MTTLTKQLYIMYSETIHKKRRLWLEGIQLRSEMNNEMNVLPIRMCFINVYIYPNPKPTPYRNEKIVFIVVQCDKNYAVSMCACPVAPYVSILALTKKAP